MKHYVAKLDIVEAWQFVKPKFAADQQSLAEFCDESGLSIIKDADGRWLVYLPDSETDDTVPTYLNQGDYLVQMDHDGYWMVVSRDDFAIDYQEIEQWLGSSR